MSRWIWYSVLAVVIAGGVRATAQESSPAPNYDESKVPQYQLPDPLVLADGQPVKNAKTWRERRRPEILRLFEENVYGRTPEAAVLPAGVSSEMLAADFKALGGRAIRKQVSIFLKADRSGPVIDLLIYIPVGAKKRTPVFVGLNFEGNHTVHADPGIRISRGWVRDAEKLGQADLAAAAAKTRGSAASRWPIERIIARGYAVATAYYGDIDPDYDDGFANGVHPLFYWPGQTRPAPDGWGSIGAWAWGLSRIMDYLETDKHLDARKSIVIGHSRLGKAALWAGAQDQRFAIVVSNNSGEGGAALTRRKFGETIAAITQRFPHWFCQNFRKFANREETLPVDAHMLLALIAPRPLYVASATEDQWADPRGEFLAAVNADRVYRWLETDGLPQLQMPRPNYPAWGTIGYHIRAGKHDITEYDWNQYIGFAEKHFAE